LIVDGKPFLALAGELGNNTATSLENMQPIWQRLVAGNLNCVLAAVSWAQVEPEEGHFEFALVDGLIQEARRNDLKLVFLWFGSWKNGLSSYAPYWVKKDLQRFPRIRIQGGKSIELLSTFGDASRDADARAYRALMRHIKEVDGREHTVLMMQVENEVGVLRDSRDRSEPAEQGVCRPGAQGADGLPPEAPRHAGPGTARGVGGQRFQDRRHVGRSFRAPASPTASRCPSRPTARR
jgi:beta-galactosidase GanA